MGSGWINWLVRSMKICSWGEINPASSADMGPFMVMIDTLLLLVVRCCLSRYGPCAPVYSEIPGASVVQRARSITCTVNESNMVSGAGFISGRRLIIETYAIHA